MCPRRASPGTKKGPSSRRKEKSIDDLWKGGGRLRQSGRSGGGTSHFARKKEAFGHPARREKRRRLHTMKRSKNEAAAPLLGGGTRIQPEHLQGKNFLPAGRKGA